MRYAGFDECELCNGLNIGVSVYVQGCNRHCKGCFNPETWDFSSGNKWTEDIEKYFFFLIDRSYIKRVSILGGEPLAYENLLDVYDLVEKIKTHYPNKKIWLYTGNTLRYNDFINSDVGCDNGLLRNHIVRMCDIIVDGEFIEEQKDLTLPFRGSKNQRLIDVKKTIKNKEITLYDNIY